MMQKELMQITRQCLTRNMMEQKLVKAKGLARELARMNLTLNTYTQCRKKIFLI